MVAELFALLPGFPLLLAFGAIVLTSAGLSHFVFVPALGLFNHYYRLPSWVFGRGLFPVEEFGVLPTPIGYAIAALFYAALAIVLSFPVCWLIGFGKQDDSRHET